MSWVPDNEFIRDINDAIRLAYGALDEDQAHAEAVRFLCLSEFF
jgi:hypothetical protein